MRSELGTENGHADAEKETWYAGNVLRRILHPMIDNPPRGGIAGKEELYRPGVSRHQAPRGDSFPFLTEGSSFSRFDLIGI